MSSTAAGDCLVARAVPIPKSMMSAVDGDGDATVVNGGGKSSSSPKSGAVESGVESLAAHLSNLKLGKATEESRNGSVTTTTTTKKSSVAGLKNGRSEPVTSPADFISFQSMRSSALARKTNTTSKISRNCGNLMADLLCFNEAELDKEKDKENVQKSTEKVAENDGEKTPTPEEQPKIQSTPKVAKEEPKVEEQESSDKDGKDEAKEEEAKPDDSSDLLTRGPDRAVRHPAGGYQPYQRVQPTALQSGVADPSAYNPYSSYAYDCGAVSYSADGREFLSNSSTPDTFNSDLGYGSATSPQQPQALRDFYPHCSVASSNAVKTLDSAELPDALSDFILKYSRRYTPSIDSGSRRNSLTSSSDHNSPKGPLVDEQTVPCSSPLCAGSAPRNSPAAPFGGVSDTSASPPNSAKQQNGSPMGSGVESHLHQFVTQHQPQKAALRRPAKERLRAMIANEDMDEAWAWTCKFIQESCECLSYQDNGGDTLLHIVVCQPNMDLAKIYALVEQMLKLDSEFSRKPFDIPNRHSETPLFMAVQKRHTEVVDYLLEAGACPNTQNSRSERESPLHYAAARGMVDIVQTLCSYPTTELNMINGMGLTPLLCAVKNHGVLEEESQALINNKATIQMLLKCGADPNITDATNGKSVFMYAVERMNADLIEIFQSALKEEVASRLVNQPDLCNETPMTALQSLVNVDPEARSKLGLALITCGASS